MVVETRVNDPLLNTYHFRRGESPGRPYGGLVSEKPFSKALSSLARSRGYESQLALSKALGKKRNSTVNCWLKGERTPNPDEFGRLLRLLQLNDSETDRLVSLWSKLL